MVGAFHFYNILYKTYNIAQGILTPLRIPLFEKAYIQYFTQNIDITDINNSL